MKITFIHPEIRNDIPGFSGYYAEGIASLAAVLKSAGHEVSLIHLTKLISKEMFTKLLVKDSPDLVGFSFMTHEFPHAKKLISWTKETLGVPIICGGIHCILKPEEVISLNGVDMVCVGEGERALVELCQKLDNGEVITNIPNIWVKNDGEIHKCNSQEVIDDLDSLPPPDRTIFAFENLTSSKEQLVMFHASRGCPFNCSYCCNHALREKYSNRKHYVRFKSVDRLLQEMKMAIKNYPFIKFIRFEDDILPLRKEWFSEFTARYPKEIGLPFECNCWPTLLTAEAADQLKKAGCTMVRVGLESGSDYIRQRILNRHVTKEQILNALSTAKAYGLKVGTYNMVGLPFETPGDITETIKINALVKPDQVLVTIFYPYPSTRLEAECFKEGSITQNKNHFDTYRESTVLSQKTITKSQTVFAHRFFRSFITLYSLCYRLPPSLRDRGVRMVDATFGSEKLPLTLLSKMHDLMVHLVKIVYFKFIIHFYNRQKSRFLNSPLSRTAKEN